MPAAEIVPTLLMSPPKVETLPTKSPLLRKPSAAILPVLLLTMLPAKVWTPLTSMPMSPVEEMVPLLVMPPGEPLLPK